MSKQGFIAFFCWAIELKGQIMARIHDRTPPAVRWTGLDLTECGEIPCCIRDICPEGI